MNSESSAQSTRSVVQFKAIQTVPCSTASNHRLQRHNHQPAAERAIPDDFAAEEKSAAKQFRVGQQDSSLETEIWRKWQIHSSGTVPCYSEFSINSKC